MTELIIEICVCYCCFVCMQYARYHKGKNESYISTGTGDDTAYSLYTANYSDPLGQSYIKELSDWSIHQQTLMP